MTQTLDREVSLVSTFLQTVEARGLEKGVAKGILLSVENLMKNTGWPFEKALSTLNVPKDQWKNYSDQINIGQNAGLR